MDWITFFSFYRTPHGKTDDNSKEKKSFWNEFIKVHRNYEQVWHNSINGNVFDIQRYSIHDGPGIRTIVFLKGCPLQCIWCQNPEGQNQSIELGFNLNNCITHNISSNK